MKWYKAPDGSYASECGRARITKEQDHRAVYKGSRRTTKTVTTWAPHVDGVYLGQDEETLRDAKEVCEKATPTRTDRHEIYQNTYWDKRGHRQKDLDKLNKLIPTEGECPANMPCLELLRKAQNAYYDLYNNCGCNMPEEIYELFAKIYELFAMRVAFFADELTWAVRYIEDHMDAYIKSSQMREALKFAANDATDVALLLIKPLIGSCDRLLQLLDGSLANVAYTEEWAKVDALLKKIKEQVR